MPSDASVCGLAATNILPLSTLYNNSQLFPDYKGHFSPHGKLFFFILGSFLHLRRAKCLFRRHGLE